MHALLVSGGLRGIYKVQKNDAGSPVDAFYNLIALDLNITFVRPAMSDKAVHGQLTFRELSRQPFNESKWKFHMTLRA